MAKVSYSNLKNKNKEKKTIIIDFQGQSIEILPYLSIKDKYDLIEITMQKSLENHIYNPVKLDMFFHLHLVYLYTNLNFTDKQKENEYEIYDTLCSCGLLKEIINNIPEEEYDLLYTYLEDATTENQKYRNSVFALIQSFIDDLPINAQKAAEMVNNFDKSQFKEVLEFAQSVNNGKIG